MTEKKLAGKRTSMLLVFMAVTTFMFQSCGEELKLDDMLPEYSGQPNEVYVFCDNVIWKDTVGAFVLEHLEERTKNLPQPEKRFTVYQFQSDDMNKARLTHRNIIKLVVDQRNENKKAAIIRKGSRWAKNQLLYEFKGPNVSEMLALIRKELPGVLEEIDLKERERALVKFRKRTNLTAQKKLSEALNLDLVIPKRLSLHKTVIDSAESFAWLEAKGKSPDGTGVLHQGIFIYSYPYVDDSAFTYKHLISKRDSVLKKQVPGSRAGQYLKTLKMEGKLPDYKEINLLGNYAVEMRGQFTMHNGYMGGPFISLTTYDENRNRLVTVEGYCYAPQLKKRDFLKEMESIVYSISFSN